jgi:hypothetical protein
MRSSTALFDVVDLEPADVGFAGGLSLTIAWLSIFEISLAVGVAWREYRRSGLSFECRCANDDAYQSSE